MTSLQSKEDCRTNDPNNAFNMDAESSLPLPLDRSMCIVFTGHFNGFGVEVRSIDEMALLHHMGCFGKGTASRSRPNVVQNDGNPSIMRKRQFSKRNYWYKKFGKSQQSDETDLFLKGVNDLIAKILQDTKKQVGKDVIDLVSSNDEDDDEEIENLDNLHKFDTNDKQNLAVIVPNSDSEDENYFANMRPKCCVDKILLQEKLMLSLEEAFFLLYGLGCLQIINNDNKILNIEECWKIFSESDQHFVEKYVVYHYFRSKGYVVKPGIKFGGDYLLYKDSPEVNHSDYIIVINFGNDVSNWISLHGHVRMATTTLKEVMMVEVLKSSKDNIKLPQDLSEFSVRELIVSRKTPLLTNNDTEDMD